MEELVSIIVPVFNAEKSLNYCLDSLLQQEYKSTEIILVNDGSSDNSGSVCDFYARNNANIRAFHKKNGGVSSARNVGIKKAKGKYIAFVDSDDYVEKEYLKCLMEAIEDNRHIGHVWCNFQMVSGYNYEDPESQYQFCQEKNYFSRKDVMTIHDTWIDTAPFCKLYLREIIVDNNLKFDERLSLGEDWLFNLAYLDIIPATSILIIDKPLYNYVCNREESLNNKYRDNILEIYQHLNSVCEKYLNKWKVSNEQMNLFYNSVFYSYDRILRNTLKNPILSRGQIMNYNNRILRSQEFQLCLSKSTCYINAAYYMAYRLKSYYIVALLDWILNNVVLKIRNKK